MKPLSQREADFSPELLRDKLESLVVSSPTIEDVDLKFYKGYATVCEKLSATGHDEDLIALQSLENAYLERYTVGLKLLTTLFLTGAVPDNFLAYGKQLLSGDMYLSILKMLDNYNKSTKDMAAVPSSNKK